MRSVEPPAGVREGVPVVTNGQLSGDGAFVEVDIDTEPSHPYVQVCLQGKDGLWYDWGGHN